MSRVRQGYLLRGVAILIAAVFSGAWTFSVAGMGGVSAAGPDETPTLPDGSSVPAEAIQAPASVSDPADLTAGNSASIVAASSTNAIPSAALAAYQRAETVINQADEACNITWQLIAAIGRVESNHGRINGSALDADGVSSPGVYGPALDGTGNVKAIRDTDGGQLDADAKWDRAVGPMQFIPSTWSIVGVDADNDGQRNPQDIDDAALAAAVYLCSGDDDLSTLAGQKAAIFRYNNSDSYVNLVLDVMEAYLAGNYTSVSGTTTAGGYLVPDPGYTPPPAYNPPSGNTSFGSKSGSGGTTTSGGSGGTSSSGGSGTDGDDGTTDGTPLPDGGTSTDTNTPVDQTTKNTTDTVDKTVNDTTDTVDNTTNDTTKVVEDTVTKLEAQTLCTAETGGPLDNPLTSKNEASLYDTCMASYGY